MRTIAVLNQKGGVGKTTTVANIAAALAASGSKVIAIDLDPQAHLTIHLGLEPQELEKSSYRVLIQSSRVSDDILMVRPNLWLLPANIDLVGAESELVSVVGREIILREALEPMQDQFDYCLIDCAPSLGLLTLNALAASQEILIPLQPHFLALQGFGKLLQTVDLINKRINPHLRVTGILLCMFDSRASLPNEVRNDIEKFLENARGTDSAWSQAQILPTFIRRNIKLAEAPSYGKTIFEYETNCHGAEDYLKVAQFIQQMGRVKKDTPPLRSRQDLPAIPIVSVAKLQHAVSNDETTPEQTTSSEIKNSATSSPSVKILEFEEMHRSHHTPEPERRQDSEPVQDTMGHMSLQPPYSTE